MSEQNNPIMNSPQVSYYEEIPELLWDSLRNDPQFKNINFVNSAPQDAVDTPVVVWRGMGWVPGNSYAKTGRRESTKQRLVSSTVSIDGKFNIEKYAQKCTGKIAFDIISKNSKESYTILNRFQRAILEALPLLKTHGVNEFIFTEVTPEWAFERKGVQLYAKQCKYTFIWDNKIELAIPRIQSITVEGYSNARRIDIPIVHGTEDIIPEKDILQIDYAFDQPYLSRESVTSLETIPEEWNPYLPELDFTYEYMDNGDVKINWLANRHIPQEGQTYYITYWYKSR